MHDGGQMDIVLMDFAKALDKVSHKILLIKLSHYGIRGPLRHYSHIECNDK